jgi:hypothetical protein
VSGHVRPDRLADFARGRLAARPTAAVEQHLAACAACRTALGRVRGADAGMEAMRQAPIPDVGSIRGEATVRWTRVVRPPPVRPGFVVALGFAGAAAGLALLLARPQPSPATRSIEAPRAVARVVRPSVPTGPIEAVVTLLGGRVQLARDGQVRPLEARDALRADDALETAAASRIAAQWAEGSGFLLLDGAELRIERLEAQRQRLLLQRGKIDVRVGPHAPGESLAVITPDHMVTVHGTWFTVAAAEHRTTVEVLEGVVEVIDRESGDSTLLHAPAHAVFSHGHGRVSNAVLGAREAAAARAQSELNLLPWPSLAAALDTTGLLNVASEPSGTLAVDGVELGPTPLQVRRPRGRHYVEVSRPSFQPDRRWVTVGAESGDLKLALPREPAVEREPASAPVEMEKVVRERARQIRACYERQLKRDPTLAGTVSLQLRVGSAGQVTHVRVEESTLSDPAVAACLVREAAGWLFVHGRNATVVYPFVFRPQ